jgi:hypothetical protein
LFDSPSGVKKFKHVTVLNARLFKGSLRIERTSVLLQTRRSGVVPKRLSCLLRSLAHEQVLIPAELLGPVGTGCKYGDDNLIVLSARHKSLDAAPGEIYLIIEADDLVVLVPHTQDENVVVDRLASSDLKNLTPSYYIIGNQVLFVVDTDAVAATPGRLSALSGSLFEVDNFVFSFSRIG